MAKRTPKTLDEIAEDNERTNEVGLFNYADAYLLCAKQLSANQPTHLRFTAPIEFLLFHAAELYLKSYLRQKGVDVDTLINKFRHYHVRMCKKATALGLKLPDETLRVFEFLDQTAAVIESRYIRTGPKQRLELPALHTIVDGLRAAVKNEHERGGVTLAATPALP